MSTSGLTRRVEYKFQPDILAQIEEARALTPNHVLVAQAQRRPQTVVQRRINRLSGLHPTHSPPSLQVLRERQTTSAPSTRTDSSTSSAGDQTSQTRSDPSIYPFNMSSSRPGSNRPTHIPIPTGTAAPPNGTPLPPASPTSPRSSFFPSFMRTRSRAATVTNRGGTSPAMEAPNPLGGGSASGGGSRDPSTAPASGHGGSVTRTVRTPAGGSAPRATAPTPAELAAVAEANPQLEGSTPKTFRIRLVPHLENSRSLAFDSVIREVLPIVVPTGIMPSIAAASISITTKAVNGKPPALILKIGRFTDKSISHLPIPGASMGASGSGPGNFGGGSGGSGEGSRGSTGIGGATLTISGGGGDICSSKVAFKSKVVSRSHAEIWCERGGKFFIRDSASSSGTFLNHIRLSSPNTDSRPTMLNDGDVLQLGVDYQGGHEEMFRCVKMRVELGRDWQRAANEFNTNALKQLQALGGLPELKDAKGKAPEGSIVPKKGKGSVTDCCICLFSVTVCQSLFIAPCSHVYHYKCIRPLLMQHHPGFSCPLCRTFANLEEDVETEDAWELASRRASVISRRPSNHSMRVPARDGSPPSLPGGNAPSDQPSSGIALGRNFATVDELLGPDNGSGHTSENGMRMTGSGHLARQATVVPESSSEAGDIDMPDNFHDEDEVLFARRATTALPALGGPAANRNPFRSNGLTIPVPPPDMTDMSDAQTPMNDTFLATLAPGMHQRLDLARQMDDLGAREVLEEDTEGELAEGDVTGNKTRVNDEGNGEGSGEGDDGWMEVDRAGVERGDGADETRRERSDVDTMFT